MSWALLGLLCKCTMSNVVIKIFTYPFTCFTDKRQSGPKQSTSKEEVNENSTTGRNSKSKTRLCVELLTPMEKNFIFPTN